MVQIQTHEGYSLLISWTLIDSNSLDAVIQPIPYPLSSPSIQFYMGPAMRVPSSMKPEMRDVGTF